MERKLSFITFALGKGLRRDCVQQPDRLLPHLVKLIEKANFLQKFWQGTQNEKFYGLPLAQKIVLNGEKERKHIFDKTENKTLCKEVF